MAAALQDGAVNAATFTDGGIADPGLREIMARMTLQEDPEFTARYPAEYNCRITIETGGGQRHTAHTAWPKGHRRNAMTDAEVEAKFRSLASGVLSPGQCDAALAAVWALHQQPDLEELFDALVV